MLNAEGGFLHNAFRPHIIAGYLLYIMQITSLKLPK